MSELISAFGSKYERITQYDEIKSGSVDGIDYLYWNGAEGKLYPGFSSKGWICDLFLRRRPRTGH